jgi:hypothetical protein
VGIDKLAAQVAEKVSENKARIRAQMDNMPIQKRELLSRKGIDPLFCYFRTHAMKGYRRHTSQENLVGPGKSR